LKGKPLPQLITSAIKAGIWEGTISGLGQSPALEVVHQGQALADVTLRMVDETKGTWRLRAPIPAGLLSDGVQTFLVTDKANGISLAHFTIITGVPMDDDLRAEIDLLRAEVDMLKRLFRHSHPANP
jgi:hypothetical protein